jgi:RNA polymerase sigma-70 factor, ECF subfamily
VEQRAWDERELVRRCKEGSEAAYAELIRQHRQRLLNLAYRLTNSREVAEDVVQDTFIAAFRTMERFEPRPSVGPWLTTIAVRFASRAAQKRGASPDTSLDRLMAAGADPDASGGVSADSLAALAADPTTDVDPVAAAEAAELRVQVARAIATLPFKHRTAVVLRFVTGMDYADAARTMDIPLNTYKSHLLRGTRSLRDALGPSLAALDTPPAGTAAALDAQAAPPDTQPTGTPAALDAPPTGTPEGAGPLGDATATSVTTPPDAARPDDEATFRAAPATSTPPVASDAPGRVAEASRGILG